MPRVAHYAGVCVRSWSHYTNCFQNNMKWVFKSIIKKARVVFATLHGTGSTELTKWCRNFNTIIIDEVSQALEPQCWISLVAYRCKKLVIVGDNKLLPPTVKLTDRKVTNIHRKQVYSIESLASWMVKSMLSF